MMRFQPTFLAACLSLIGLSATSAFAQKTPKIDDLPIPAKLKSEVSTYKAKVKLMVESATAASPDVLEKLAMEGYGIAYSLGDEIGENEKLRSLDVEEFEIPGFRASAGEFYVYVSMDVKFFGGHAKRLNLVADQAYFETFGLAHPENGIYLRHSYEQQMTDIGSCTIYGKGEDGQHVILKEYNAWTNFRRNFPGRYASSASANIGTIEDELMNDSICACEEEVTPVLELLNRFVQENPRRSAAPKVKAIVDGIKSKKIEPRLNCSPG